MNQINELSALINQTFNWNKARIDCLVGMLIALLSTRSINLAELAIAFPSPAKPDSRYQRIQRFISIAIIYRLWNFSTHPSEKFIVINNYFYRRIESC
ncbi:MAG: hypothetical protein IPL99_16470 [Candidatus Competibacteraceae bacterium]|nr:hypothetical protein [Candidatus Competibacteraceae bacterium]